MLSDTDPNANGKKQRSATEMEPGGKDLVADLTALQKEVDELRGQFGR